VRYLSLFSGIEAASVAWEPLGWEAVGFAEFEDFPKAVLAHHYPDVPDLGDVTLITEEQIKALGHIDIVVGGSPCQDLSVAGKRAGLRNEDGSTTRSGLFDEQMRIFEIAREYNGCRYLLWENVPGAFSSNGGDDFAYVLGSMVGGGISVPPDGWKNSGVAISGDRRRLVEWRVLDAQNFGVPQRRRRIFALLDTGAWWSRQPILFEQEGVCRNTTQSRVEGKRLAEGAEGSVGGGIVMATSQANTEILKDKCPTLMAGHEQPIYCGDEL
jgi:DNA (cytosine-5)-methyltransferase 1